jgi:hypothetical protein
MAWWMDIPDAIVLLSEAPAIKRPGDATQSSIGKCCRAVALD